MVSLLWTDGGRHLPCDYRVCEKADARTKNEQFADMIRTARGFTPRCVVFDSWRSRLGSLKPIRAAIRPSLTRLKSNRLVNKDREGIRAVAGAAIAPTDTVVWLTK